MSYSVGDLYLMAAWKCPLCTGKYVSLFELIGAVHYDDEYHSYACVASSCSLILASTASWYKHIVTEHAEEYYNKLPNSYEEEHNESTDSSVHSDEEVCVDEGDGDDVTDDDGVCMVQSDWTTEEDAAQSSISKEKIAGQLIKLKEMHLLSHSAVDEVISLVQMVCDSVTSNALSAVIQCNGIDNTSSSCKDLLCKVGSFVSPLATVSTTYRQEAYISKNLPFVVSAII